MLVEYFVRSGFAGVMVQSEAVPLLVAVEHWPQWRIWRASPWALQPFGSWVPVSEWRAR
jgi:hypothetical protein